MNDLRLQLAESINYSALIKTIRAPTVKLVGLKYLLYPIRKTIVHITMK